MSRSLGSLTLDLVARTAGFQEGMTKAERSTKKFRQQAEKDFKAISAAVKTGALAVTAAAGAATAGAGALVAFTNSSAESARELRNQAQVANASVEEFQRYSYAARTAGIESDKFSDILKDFNDRIGDFANTGGGPMVDFFEKIAPQVGVTAQQFQRLSGPEALQLYYKSLEQANLSQAEMTFYLEAMASDTTALIPLLRNGGERLEEMAAEAGNLGIVLSELEIARLDEFATQFDRITSIMSAASNVIASELAPYLSVLADYLVDAGGHSDELKEKIPDFIRSSIVWIGGFLDKMQEFRIYGLQAELTFAEIDKAVAQFAYSAQDKLSYFYQTGINGLNNLLKAYNALPGVDDVELIGSFRDSAFFENYKENLAATTQEVEKLRKKLKEAAEAEDYSVIIQKFLDDVDTKNAEINERLENESENSLGRVGQTAQEVADAVAAAAENAKKEAEELNKKLQESAQEISNLFASLNPDASALVEYNNQISNLQFALQNNKINQLEFTAGIGAASLNYNDEILRNKPDTYLEDAPDFSFGNDTASEFNRIDQNRDKLEKWYEEQSEMLENFHTKKLIAEEEYQQKRASLEEQYSEKSKQLAEATASVQLSAFSDGFSQITESLKKMDADNNAIYSAMFTASKAFAIAESIVKIQQGIASAASLPFPANLGAMGTVAAATSSIVSTISSTQLQGMAHDGIDSVPEDGSWYLQKGERVTTAETSAKLDRTLNDIQNNKNINNNSNQTITYAPTINVESTGGGNRQQQEQDYKKLMDADRSRFKQWLIAEKKNGGILSR